MFVHANCYLHAYRSQTRIVAFQAPRRHSFCGISFLFDWWNNAHFFFSAFAEISFSVGRWTTHIKAVIRRRRFSVILIKLIRELLLVELPECGKHVSFFSRLTESVNKTPSGMLYTVLYLCEVISPPGVFPGTSTKSESRIQEVNWAWRIYCFKPFSLACKAWWTTVWGTLSWICISSLLVL